MFLMPLPILMGRWTAMIELKLADGLDAPGLQMNSTKVWARYNGGPWVITKYRSLNKARAVTSRFGSEQQAFNFLTEEEE